jgi:hypothetical protein
MLRNQYLILPGYHVYVGTGYDSYAYVQYTEYNFKRDLFFVQTDNLIIFLIVFWCGGCYFKPPLLINAPE